MTEPTPASRSRRALLVAAAGGAAALAASAALPLTAVAHDAEDVQKGVNNPTTDTTTVTNATADLPAFAGSATGTGYGIQGTSAGGAGVFAWSNAAPMAGTRPPAPTPASSAGRLPQPTRRSPAPVCGARRTTSVSTAAARSGSTATATSESLARAEARTPALLAVAKSATDVALDVRGKVKFSRSGRSTIGAGKSSSSVTLAGVSSSSRIFAVLHSNRPGRWVRRSSP